MSKQSPKEISIDDLVGSEKTTLVKPNQTEELRVKTKFYTKPLFIIIVTIVLTLSAVYGIYRLHNHVYSQGYNDAIQERQMIEKEVAKLKKNQ